MEGRRGGDGSKKLNLSPSRKFSALKYADPKKERTIPGYNPIFKSKFNARTWSYKCRPSVTNLVILFIHATNVHYPQKPCPNIQTYCAEGGPCPSNSGMSFSHSSIIYRQSSQTVGYLSEEFYFGTCQLSQGNFHFSTSDFFKFLTFAFDFLIESLTQQFRMFHLSRQILDLEL